MENTKLFAPIRVGNMSLKHRVVMAPLGRRRANAQHVPTELMAEYYAQRASTPGTFIIAESTGIAPQACGVAHAPCVYSDDQVAGWKMVTDAVHAQGSFIYLQLWATGRTGSPEVLRAEGPFPLVSSSTVPLPGTSVEPHSLTIEGIVNYLDLYVAAAQNAIRAGFDGVEVHCAHGYLIDQFTQDSANKRDDSYGGSFEGRCRFALEVIGAVVNAIGEHRTGFRLSPWSDFNAMKTTDRRQTFAYLVKEVARRHTNLAYLHLVEPRVAGAADRVALQDESNDFLREIWGLRPLIIAGAFERASAIEMAETSGSLVSFGRLFISNPDLPIRLKHNIPAYKGNRDTYFTHESPIGYIDYPFADGTVAPARFKPGHLIDEQKALL